MQKLLRSDRVKSLLHKRYRLRRTLIPFMRSKSTVMIEGCRSAWIEHCMQQLHQTERALRFNLWGDERGYV